MRRSNAPCGTQRNWVRASKYQKRSLIIVSSIVGPHVPPDENSLKEALACFCKGVRMGWDGRSGTPSICASEERLRGATVMSGSDSRHSTSHRREKQRLLRARLNPQTCGERSSAALQTRFTERVHAWVVKNVQQHRRAEACSSGTHLSAPSTSS